MKIQKKKKKKKKKEEQEETKAVPIEDLATFRHEPVKRVEKVIPSEGAGAGAEGCARWHDGHFRWSVSA